jgi:hypothetical protein
MQANLNKTVQIEAENAWCYHLKTEKSAVDPRDPKHPRVKTRIMVLEPDNYKKYFQCSVDDQIGFLKTMGIENVELVHDPTIESYVRIEVEKSAEQKLHEEKKMQLASAMRKRKPSEK